MREILNIGLDVQIRVYVCHNENTVELEMLIVELVVRAVRVMEVEDQVEVIRTHTTDSRNTLRCYTLFTTNYLLYLRFHA